MNKKLSIKKNMFIFAIGVFFTKIVAFFFVPLYSKYLSVPEFGDVDVLTASASLAIPIFTLAITEGVIKYGIDDKSDLKKVFSTSFIIASIGAFLMSLALILTGQYIYSNYLWTTLLFFIAECFFLFFQAFAKAQKNTIAYVISSIIYSIVSTVLIVLFIIVEDFGVNGYMLGMAIGTLAAIVFLLFVCKTWNYFSFKSIDKATVITMVKYSAPLALSNVGYWVITASDKYITKIVMGDEPTAYLSVIHKIPTLCTLLFSIFNYAYTMSALKDHQLTDSSSEEDNLFYSKLFDYVVLMLIIGSLIVSLFSQWIVSLYASAYRDYWIYVPLYTFGVILGSFRSFYTSIYCVKEKTLKIMIIVFVGATINAASCFLLMKYTDLGLWSTAISTISCNLFIFLFYYFDSFKYVKIRVNWREISSLIVCISSSILPIVLFDNPIVYYSLLSAFTIFVIVVNYKTIVDLGRSVLKKH